MRGRRPAVPTVLGPHDVAGRTSSGAVLGPGAGDNAAAALGLGAGPGDCIVSLGTSGVVSAVGETAPHDPEGIVAGFADATGRQLPLVCTLNGAPVLAAVATMLGVDFDELDRLALSAPAGADGLTLVPYFEGERSPNLPECRRSVARCDDAKPDLRQRRPGGGGRLAGFDGLLHRQDCRAGRRRRARHPGRWWRALGGRPAHRPGDLGQAGARADTGRVRGPGCGPASGMGTLAGGFAAVMVVRSDRHLYRRGHARGPRPVSGRPVVDVGSVNFAWERLGDGVFRCRLPFLDVTVGVAPGSTGTLLIDTGSTLTEARAIDQDVRAMTHRAGQSYRPDAQPL